MLIDAKGMTLYTWDNDKTANKSSCNGMCLMNWPALKAEASDQNMDEFTVITRDDGSRQWAYKGKPLYYFRMDAKAGDTAATAAAWSGTSPGRNNRSECTPGTFAASASPREIGCGSAKRGMILNEYDISHDWTVAEVLALFALPFGDLIFRAQTLHRKYLHAQHGADFNPAFHQDRRLSGRLRLLSAKRSIRYGRKSRKAHEPGPGYRRRAKRRKKPARLAFAWALPGANRRTAIWMPSVRW